MVYLFYTTYISEELAHHEIFRDKIGKGGISSSTGWFGFGLLLYVPGNSYGHVGMVNSSNHTFFPGQAGTSS